MYRSGKATGTRWRKKEGESPMMPKFFVRDLQWFHSRTCSVSTRLNLENIQNISQDWGGSSPTNFPGALHARFSTGTLSVILTCMMLEITGSMVVDIMGDKTSKHYQDPSKLSQDPSKHCQDPSKLCQDSEGSRVPGSKPGQRNNSFRIADPSRNSIIKSIFY